MAETGRVDLLKSEVLGGVRGQGTIDVAARREIFEATGITVKMRARTTGPQKNLRILFFHGPVDGDAANLQAAEQLAHDFILQGFVWGGKLLFIVPTHYFTF